MQRKSGECTEFHRIIVPGIITGDKALFHLRPIRNIPILNAVDFLNKL